MDTLKPYTILLARILLSALFLTSVYGKLSNVPGFLAYLQSGGISPIFGWPVILLELGGGLAVLFGFATRLAALALALFALITAVMVHFAPADMGQMINFYKNLGLAGGFLLLATTGAGPLSLDAAVKHSPRALFS